MMYKFFVPSAGTADWRAFLADPDKHWKDGYSAKMLAEKWENARGFPREVTASFLDSDISLFHKIEFIAGFPEFKVVLPGGERPSQTDLMVLARSADKIVVIAVEGKAEEGFGQIIRHWAAARGAGRKERLGFLMNLLGLAEENINDVRYQLLHRTASAVLTAQEFASRHCVVLVHSFSPADTGFNDYRAYLRLFGSTAVQGRVQAGHAIGNINLYFLWARGH